MFTFQIFTTVHTYVDHIKFPHGPFKLVVKDRGRDRMIEIKRSQDQTRARLHSIGDYNTLRPYSVHRNTSTSAI